VSRAIWCWYGLLRHVERPKVGRSVEVLCDLGVSVGGIFCGRTEFLESIKR
jgi:hypothetical protein